MNLSWQTFNLQLADSWATARGSSGKTSSVMFVQLVDRGVLGVGEASPISRYGESVATVEAFFKGINPERLSFEALPASMDYLDELSPGDKAAKCAVEVALLDGAAKRKKQALHELLGLKFRDGVHITSFTIGIDESDMIRKKVLAAERFPVLKIKVGVAGDKENWKVLREVAPKKWVRVDANEGWKKKEQALEMMEWLAADGRVQFVEQPLPAKASARDWAWLKKRSPLPIFADESYHTEEDLERIADGVHGVNVKLSKAGGVLAAQSALTAARKLGLKTMLGCMVESSVLISAATHLAELCDYLDLDGNLLVTNDPYVGATGKTGLMTFAEATEKFGVRVGLR